MPTFSYDGSVIQYETIAVTSSYDIVASGGQGGDARSEQGGLAASSGGDVFLQAGAVLEIVVGGQGGSGGGNGGGGGGGSFVIEINDGSAAVDINEVIAGGGGGASYQKVGGSGLAAPTGGNGGGQVAGAGGVNGAAGGGGRSGGGGGGGFKGGKGGGVTSAGKSGTAGVNAFSGGAGGATGGAGGGFGGGGGGGFFGGGGGGGFGGGGGAGSDFSGGGGGGSYVTPAATAPAEAAGVHGGNGAVSITSAPAVFSYDGTVIQYDTIAVSGTYDIVASGGQGGSTSYGQGGLAASSGGDIYLKAGAVLEIVVGGVGATSVYGAGGGGGSFVIEINDGTTAVDVNEVIAGGGGGAGSRGAGGSGLGGPTGGNGGGVSGGTGGVDGAAGSGGLQGGGGGGFEGGQGGNAVSPGSSGIADFGNFTGGGGGSAGGGGGGFGGAGGGGYSGGGGGGGYGGGGGGGYSSGGGGGGSFVNSTVGVVQTPGIHGGNGQVSVVQKNSQAPCFCLGTRIQTACGDSAVEDLAIGDLAVTANGGMRPVVWIGHRRIDLTRHANPMLARPIRIAAGAFPDGMPYRDLLVSPDHAVAFDGMLIAAKLLVNGATIAVDTVCREVTYFHVELDSHDIILAEGLAAESYLDTGNRAMFENGGQAMVLHPDFGVGQAARVSRSCLPFADRPDQVEPVWRALADRAEAQGRVLPRPDLTDDPDLHLLIGTRRIDPVAVRGRQYTFLIPNGDAPIHLSSRSACPRAGRPWIADDRHLGAMVVGLAHRCGDEARDVAMDDPVLAHGWWDVECDDGRPGRWMGGDALLPIPGAGVLVVELGGRMLYPAERTGFAGGWVAAPVAA
jgi:hypothetical protein